MDNTISWGASPRAATDGPPPASSLSLWSVTSHSSTRPSCGSLRSNSSAALPNGSGVADSPAPCAFIPAAACARHHPAATSSHRGPSGGASSATITSGTSPGVASGALVLPARRAPPSGGRNSVRSIARPSWRTALVGEQSAREAMTAIDSRSAGLAAGTTSSAESALTSCDQCVASSPPTSAPSLIGWVTSTAATERSSE
mmetsp:Transcript_14671/g.44781  ORF Transcript_14671/g.44781 Transcript_14671/m.44781 type:complete len:201 (-) Transcript_14671:2461-3063(-)|eukprot:scaffold171044_cov30-Tisochrysis_lutea.AAC.7